MKKILALMLVFVSLFAFAACGGKETKKDETTTAQAQATEESAASTKISAIAGKRIKLKSVASLNSVTIYTNADGIASYMLVHKIFADDAAFEAALAAGDYGTYKLHRSNAETREIIYSDGETVKGMTYDEIMAQAEKLDDYIIIPEK